MDQGRREHAALLSTFDDSKKVVNVKSFFLDCYRFNRRAFYPCIVPIEYVVTYMVQSGNYVLSPDFINAFRKMDLDEARAYWEMIHEHEQTSVDDVMRIIFDPRSYDKRSRKRYFMTHSSLLNRQGTIAPTVTSSVNNNDPTTPGTNNIATRIITQCRAVSSASTDSGPRQQPQYPEEDFVPLPPLRGDDHDNNSCPATLLEMMNIVKKIRDECLRRNHAAPPSFLRITPTTITPSHLSLSSSSSSSSSNNTSQQEDVPSTPPDQNAYKKTRTNNYRQFC